MFGFRYIKASPSTYLIQYKAGKAVREGTGLAFWYFAPSASLVSIPMESVDAPFMFQEVSSDFQVVTVQGQATYRVSAPTTLAGLMNFTLKPDGNYVSEDRTKLPQRVVNAVQVQLRSVLQGQTLQQLLQGSDHLVQVVRQGLQRPDGLPSLGLELVNLSILAVKPNPETARAQHCRRTRSPRRSNLAGTDSLPTGAVDIVDGGFVFFLSSSCHCPTWRNTYESPYECDDLQK